MMDFNKKLERTPKSLFESRKFIVESNKEFLIGKSLLEFGVYGGDSLEQFSQLYDEFGIKKIFYGFDSFQGLPEEILDKNNPDYWGVGAFSGMYYAEHLNNRLPFVRVKDGWFKDTLNNESLTEIKQNQVAIFHIDCDIYTSTIQVLEWIVNNNLLVDGSLIIYDDWAGHYSKNVGEYECGEGKAHKEICEKYNLNLDFVTCDEIGKEYHEICVFRYNEN